MLVFGALWMIIGAQAPALSKDSASLAGASRASDVVMEVASDSVRLLPIAADTPHTRPKVVEVSDWYSRRLTIHRIVAYSTVPVFALQWIAGNQIWQSGAAAPTWAKTTHRAGATTLAGMFTVNTVTGVWNWWDSRSASQGRLLRTIHALTMLGTDAAFTYAGAKLSNEAETSQDKRSLHRTVALSSIGVTIASGLAMKIWNR
jgi:hypothetical protein